MDAVITAGGRISGDFAGETGVNIKALAEVCGKPVIRTVVDAVRGLSEVDKIYVVGPDELRDSPAADLPVELISEGPHGAVNFLLGLEQCSTAGDCRALFAASDLPFLTTESVKSYINMCPPDGDFCYPVTGRGAFEAAYPGSSTKFERLRGGYYTGGSVFLLNPEILRARKELITRVFMARKNPVRLAAIAGWKLLLGFVTRTASIDSCAKRASEVLNCNCCAVLNSPPELVYDLDDLDDYQYALKHCGGIIC